MNVVGWPVTLRSAAAAVFLQQQMQVVAEFGQVSNVPSREALSFFLQKQCAVPEAVVLVDRISQSRMTKNAQYGQH